ncbi:MAG: ester cyclase [Acidimicrobiia bacterium]
MVQRIPCCLFVGGRSHCGRRPGRGEGYHESGTHGGDFMGSPPTGKRVSVQEVDIFRIENGEIAEAWAAVDFFGMLTQLGLLPSEEPVG